MSKLPKIINLLNTNLITNSGNNSGTNKNTTESSSNNISIGKLQKILSQNFNNIIAQDSESKGLELLGQGVNGSIYKIKSPKQDYICKCIIYSKENEEQFEYELDLIQKLQNHPITVRYVNPCLGMAITDDYIITIFPRFHATTIDQIIKTMQEPHFNTPQRVSLIKYLIYQMILAVSYMHHLNICHRQINEGSILVEVKNNTVKETSSKNSDGPWFSEEEMPLRVKLTNFGFGCLNSCLPIMSDIDPYQPTGPSDLENSKKFDVWCLGVIFAKLLHEPNTTKLISSDLEGFLDVVNNFMLVPMESRKPADYIKDMLAINDKLYDELGGSGRTESENLIEKVLRLINGANR